MTDQQQRRRAELARRKRYRMKKQEEYRRTILAALRARGPSTAWDITEDTNLKPNQLAQHLILMQREGLVTLVDELHVSGRPAPIRTYAFKSWNGTPPPRVPARRDPLVAAFFGPAPTPTRQVGNP